MPSEVNKIRIQNKVGADLAAWTGAPLHANDLLQILIALQREVGADELAVVRVADSSPLVRWASFPPPSCSLPGADIGQLSDARFTTTSGSGLHLQRFRHSTGLVVDAHLDAFDGCTMPIEHAADSTRSFEFAALAAAVAGAVTYLATGSGKAALGVAALGAGGGAIVGANTPKKCRVVFDLATLLAIGNGWSFA